MNPIQEDVLNIIYSYKNKIITNNINNEIKETSYNCLSCDKHNNIKINKSLKCSNCYGIICILCTDYYIKSEKICFICKIKEDYIKEIELLLKDKLTIVEKERYLYLLELYDVLEIGIIDIISMISNIPYNNNVTRQHVYDIIERELTYDVESDMIVRYSDDDSNIDF